MTNNFQEKPLKPWHKALLRFTLPIVWVLLLVCTAFTIVFLGPICCVAAYVSWVISGKIHLEYTVIPAVFPLALGYMYIDWLKENDVINV